MARAFVAVRPSGQALDTVAGAVRRARGVSAGLGGEGLRWVERDDWHLTLQFLGRVSGVADVVEVLAAVAKAQRPFSCRLGGGGAFPSVMRARVVWLGVVDGSSSLESLARAVSAAVAPLGYEPDERPWHPHLTVARLARVAPVGPVVDGLGDTSAGEAWDVASIGVYESHPSSRGARYRLIEELPFGRPPRDDEGA